MDQAQLLELAKQTIAYLSPLLTTAAADTLSEGAKQLARKAWQLLQRRFGGDQEAADELAHYAKKPDNQRRQAAVIEQIVTRFASDEVAARELAQLVQEARRLNLLPQPSGGRTHNLNIGGNAQVGTAIVGDVHGDLDVGSITFGSHNFVDSLFEEGAADDLSVGGTETSSSTRHQPEPSDTHSPNTKSSRSIPPLPPAQASGSVTRGGTRSISSPIPTAPSAPAPPSPAPAPRPRHLVARFPERVRLGTRVPLQIRIAREAGGYANTSLKPFDIPADGADVQIALFSTGFAISSRDMLRTIRTPLDGDSDWMLYELEAQHQGTHTLDVTAYIGGAFLGTLSLQATVDPAAETSQDVEHSSVVTLRKPEQGEVTLEIHYDRLSKVYRFQLRSATIGETDEIVSQGLLDTPEAQVNKFATLMNAQARNLTNYTSREARRWLKGMGTELWQALIPSDLNHLFWEYQPTIARLTILSAGDPMPWEMLYPFDTRTSKDEGFLAEQFPVTRWIFGPPPPSRLALKQPCFVLPDNAPPTASAEIQALQAALGGQTLSDLDPLLDVLDAGNFGVLHFAAHNVYQPDYLTSSYVPLGKKHFDQTFVGPSFQGKFRPRSPLVFMNACRSDGMAPSYTELAGWARSFVKAGAGAFIGSLWEIRDGSATRFAQQFYQSLLSGSTLGDAMTTARQTIQADDADPTWLAYTLYGNPTATIIKETTNV